MATFSGNETVNAVVRVSTSSSGVVYTCPTNKYAKVFVEKVTLGAGNNIVIGENTFTNGSGSPVDASTMFSNANFDNIRDIYLYDGQTIINTHSSNVRMTIIEFAIP